MSRPLFLNVHPVDLRDRGVVRRRIAVVHDPRWAVGTSMLQAQLRLGCELGLSVFLHERDAHLRFVAILPPHRDRLRGGVVH